MARQKTPARMEPCRPAAIDRRAAIPYNPAGRLRRDGGGQVDRADERMR